MLYLHVTSFNNLEFLPNYPSRGDPVHVLRISVHLVDLGGPTASSNNEELLSSYHKDCVPVSTSGMEGPWSMGDKKVPRATKRRAWAGLGSGYSLFGQACGH